MATEAIRLPAQILTAVVSHTRFCLPEEGCGLLAFDDVGEMRMAYALTNVDRSRVRFTVSPREHYGAIRHAERNGWSIGGSFHSHPESAAYPSARDIAGALDPSWLYMVVGLDNGLPDVRGYRIRNRHVSEVTLREVS